MKTATNPDAHNEEGLKDSYVGVGIGRKGWLEPRDVFTRVDLEKMKAFWNGGNPSRLEILGFEEELPRQEA